jgi:hypothetical protein
VVEWLSPVFEFICSIVSAQVYRQGDDESEEVSAEIEFEQFVGDMNTQNTHPAKNNYGTLQ